MRVNRFPGREKAASSVIWRRPLPRVCYSGADHKCRDLFYLPN